MSWCKWFSLKWKQVIYCSILGGTLIGTGTVIGWTAEVSRIAEDTEKKFVLSESELGWLVSSSGVAAIAASIFSGILIDITGPCRTMAFLFLPTAMFWIVMTASDSYNWLLFGRIFTGAVAQIQMTAVQPLIAELCQPDIRGMMATMPDFWVSFGVSLVYVLSRFLTWQTGTQIAGILAIASVIFIMFVPESPYWHIHKGNYKAALRSLKQLRSSPHDAEVAFTTIRESISNPNDTGSFLDQFKSLQEPGNYRPIILLSVLFILREFGGAMIIFMFSAYFFQNAGFVLDRFQATLLVGIFRLVFTVISAIVSDSVGRRVLYILSTLICSMVLYIIGMTLTYNQLSITWMPLVGVFVFTAAFSLGAGPIPWVLTGEMLPTPVRYIGSSICSLVFSVAFYLQILYIPSILTEYGLDNMIVVFATIQLASAIVAYLFLPETENRTLEDLQTSFAGSTMRPLKKKREGYIQAHGATYSKNAIN